MVPRSRSIDEIPDRMVTKMVYGDPREKQIDRLRQELETVTARLRLCTEQLGEKSMEIERLKRRLTELQREKENLERRK